MIRRTFRPAISPASLVAVRWVSLKYAGTVITASVTSSPRYASASRFSFCSTRAEISCAVYRLPSTSPWSGNRHAWSPMCRLTERAVRSTFVTACRLATSPTSTSPFLANATTDGVVRAPSVLVMTVGSPPSRTETTEFVVPRSIPTARAMVVYLRAGLLLMGCLSEGPCWAEIHAVKQVESVQLNSGDTGSTGRDRVLFPLERVDSGGSADGDGDRVGGAVRGRVEDPEE